MNAAFCCEQKADFLHQTKKNTCHQAIDHLILNSQSLKKSNRAMFECAR